MSAARRKGASLLTPTSNSVLRSALSDAELRYASLRRPTTHAVARFFGSALG